MNAGTNRKIRDLIMRQARPTPRRTRDVRQRPLPTKHGHARLCSGHAGVIRGYQMR